MTTTVVFGDLGDGLLYSNNAVYATARAGSSVTLYNAADSWIGQDLPSTYFLNVYFGAWDTSGIPDTDTVSAAYPSLFGISDSSATDFIIEAAPFDFGTLDTGDWQDGTELGALTVVATFATSGGFAAAYNDFTEVAGGLAAAINKTGTTRLVFFSDRQRVGTTNTGQEYVYHRTSDQAGTTNDPKLTITHTAVDATFDPMGMSGFFGI